MNQEAGIRLTLQADVSQSASQAAGELNQIAQSADVINESLDPKVLDDYNRKLTEIGENYSRIRNNQRNQAMSAQRAVSQVGGAVNTGLSQTMASGDVVGGAIGGAKGLGGLLTGLGPLGAAAGLAIGGLGVANMGANYYFGRSEPARRLAGMQGLYGFDPAENSERLRNTMNRVIDQVAEYGHTYEQGTQAVQGFLLAGGTNFESTRAAQYSAAYGVDLNQTMAFEGGGQRFGENRGLQATRALVHGQGLLPSMFGEMMQGLNESFQQTLSMGIVRGFDDIARSQMYFSGAGQTWTGALGQQRVAQMDQAVRGAAGLGNQSDIFMYRAASQLGGGGLLETRKMLEQGMTPELFQGVRGQLERYGYGRTESILQMSRMFGLSTTAAEDLYDMRGASQAEFNELLKGDLAPPVGQTTETEYIGSVEGIKQAVGNVGATLFDTKQNIAETGEKLVKFMESLVSGDREMPIEYAGITVENATMAITASTAGGPVPHLGSFMDPRQYGAAMARKTAALQAGVDPATVASIFESVFAPESAGAGKVTRGEGEMIVERLDELIAAVREPTTVEETPSPDNGDKYRNRR